MNGKELWLRIFNTDFEEAVLSHLDFEKNFDDEGTDEENKEIVEALEGHTIEDIMNWRCNYEGWGIDTSMIREMFEQLQVKNIDEEVRNWD